MGNITNGISPLPSRNDTDPLVLAGRYIAESLAKPQSHLNVSKTDFPTFVSILVARNILVCHGIFHLVPVPMTYQFLLALASFVFVFLTAQCVVNFALVWAVFGAIWCLTTKPVAHLSPFVRLIIVVTFLTAIPPNVNLPCTLESVLDILLVVYMFCFLIKTFLGPIERIYKMLFFELAILAVFSAVDVACGANGNYFMLFININSFLPLVVEAYNRREMVCFLPLLVSFNNCVINQVWINLNNHSRMIMDHYKNPFQKVSD